MTAGGEIEGIVAIVFHGVPLGRKDCRRDALSRRGKRANHLRYFAKSA